MIEKAKAKLEAEINSEGNVVIIQAKLPEIPLQKETVDVVVFNCVLNHLVRNPDGTNFTEMEQALAEAHRVLNPGGIICIMTVLPSTVKRSFWYTNIHKNIGEKGAKRFPTIPQFDQMFTQSKFQRLNAMHLCLAEMTSMYHTPDWPLDKNWRDFTVFWEEATEEELDYVMTEVRRMKEAGTLKEYMNANDRTYETGFMTLVFARAL